MNLKFNSWRPLSEIIAWDNIPLYNFSAFFKFVNYSETAAPGFYGEADQIWF